MEPITRMKIEAGVGGVLATAPWWVDALQNVNLIASAIAAVCGAIYGLYTVLRIAHVYLEKKRLEKLNRE